MADAALQFQVKDRRGHERLRGRPTIASGAVAAGDGRQGEFGHGTAFRVQIFAHRILTCGADACMYLHALRADLMQYETNTAKIIARLTKEGWKNVGGTKHTKMAKDGHRNIMVPRHRHVTPGVAKGIAKDAGWKGR
jgi:predicted RNA binding protein YcfA (HicA-like mRNA interferase family)